MNYKVSLQIINFVGVFEWQVSDIQISITPYFSCLPPEDNSHLSAHSLNLLENLIERKTTAMIGKTSNHKLF